MKVETKIKDTLMGDLADDVPPAVYRTTPAFCSGKGFVSQLRFRLLQFWHLVIDLRVVALV